MYGTRPHAACCNRQRSNGVVPGLPLKASPPMNLIAGRNEAFGAPGRAHLVLERQRIL